MTNNKKIRAIEKGWGEDSTFYSTANAVDLMYRVDEIKCEETFLGKGPHGDLTILVYQIIKDNKLIAEIEANSNLTIRYE